MGGSAACSAFSPDLAAQTRFKGDTMTLQTPALVAHSGYKHVFGLNLLTSYIYIYVFIQFVSKTFYNE